MPSPFRSRGRSFALVAAFVSSFRNSDPIPFMSVRAASHTNEEAEPPNLPLGDMNVVVLTDVHSWVASHRHQEPYYDADLGDVLSFWELLKERVEGDRNKGRDIFFVNNGDFVDGTGLSRTIDSQNDPSALLPLLEKMPYDAVNVGNHELYSKSTIEAMTRAGGYVDWWGDRYLTSNIHAVEPKQTGGASEKRPLGNHYKVLVGSGGGRLLAFGFLYNMGNYARGAGIGVEHVESVVAGAWFRKALEEERYDAVLVLAHMDLVDPLVEKLRSAIRGVIGNETPIVFVTGHTHYRGVKQLDDRAVTFEAGRYMDTVGFVSFPRKGSAEGGSASSLFRHRFLDTNRGVLFNETLGLSHPGEWATSNGAELSSFVDRTRKKLGLEREIGCAPRSYYLEKPVDDPDSLWGLYRDEVVPGVFSGDPAATASGEDLPVAMLLSSESWRYDLYSNATLWVDDIVAVAPFNDTVVHLGTFEREVILGANATLNQHRNQGGGGDFSWHPVVPRFVLIGNLDGSESPEGDAAVATKYHLYTHEFGAETVRRAVEKAAPPDEPVEIRRTEHTSTLIWLAFVKEYWPCNGSEGSGAGKIHHRHKLPPATHPAAVAMAAGHRGEYPGCGTVFAWAGVLCWILSVLWRMPKKHPAHRTLPGAGRGGNKDGLGDQLQDSSEHKSPSPWFP